MRVVERMAAGAVPMIAVLVATFVIAVPVEAQQSAGPSTASDTVPVMLWTLTVAVLAMLALSLGYLYRHIQGQPDEVIPKDVPVFAAEGSHGNLEHTYGETHPEEEVHGDAGIEQPDHPGAIVAVADGAHGDGQSH